MAKSSRFVVRKGHTLVDLTAHLRRSCRAIDDVTARGLVNYLVTVGVVKVIGEHGVPGQRGRRAHVYDWSPEAIATHFANVGTPARETLTTPPAPKRAPAAPKAAAPSPDAVVAAIVEQSEGLAVANLTANPLPTAAESVPSVTEAIEAGPATELPAEVLSLADAISAE